MTFVNWHSYCLFRVLPPAAACHPCSNLPLRLADRQASYLGLWSLLPRHSDPHHKSLHIVVHKSFFEQPFLFQRSQAPHVRTSVPWASCRPVQHRGPGTQDVTLTSQRVGLWMTAPTLCGSSPWASVSTQCCTQCVLPPLSPLLPSCFKNYFSPC